MLSPYLFLVANLILSSSLCYTPVKYAGLFFIVMSIVEYTKVCVPFERQNMSKIFRGLSKSARQGKIDAYAAVVCVLSFFVTFFFFLDSNVSS